MNTKATRQQQKFFFALCERGNWDKIKTMERAKKLFNLESFADISETQLSVLLKKMTKKIAEDMLPDQPKV